MEPKVTNATPETFVTCQFTVLNKKLQGTSTQAVKVGKTIDLGVTPASGYTAEDIDVDPAHINDPTISYYSSDETIATVSGDGVVTGISPGEVTIFAKATDSKNNGEIEKPFLLITVTITKNTPPIIKAEDKKIKVNDPFDPKKDVTATDPEDGDLTDAVVVISNNVDTSKAGIYQVTYSVTDGDGATTIKTITVTVVGEETPDPETLTPDEPKKPGTVKPVAPKGPKTGDSGGTALVTILMLAGGATCLGLAKRKWD